MFMVQFCVSNVAAELSAVKDVVTIVAALTGVFVGFFGLQTWRRQMRGQSEHTVARSVLRDVYKLRDAITVVRNPWISADEMVLSEEERAAELSMAQRHFLGYSKAYSKRWAAVVEARRELRVDMFDARALWAEALTQPVEKIDGLMRELFNAMNRSIRMNNPEQAGDSLEAVKKAHASKRDVLYLAMGDDEPDPYASDLDDAIEKIEQFIRPKI